MLRCTSKEVLSLRNECYALINKSHLWQMCLTLIILWFWRKLKCEYFVFWSFNFLPSKDRISMKNQMSINVSFNSLNIWVNWTLWWTIITFLCMQSIRNECPIGALQFHYNFIKILCAFLQFMEMQFNDKMCTLHSKLDFSSQIVSIHQFQFYYMHICLFFNDFYSICYFR